MWTLKAGLPGNTPRHRKLSMGLPQRRGAAFRAKHSIIHANIGELLRQMTVRQCAVLCTPPASPV